MEDPFVVPEKPLRQGRIIAESADEQKPEKKRYKRPKLTSNLLFSQKGFPKLKEESPSIIAKVTGNEVAQQKKINMN